MAEHPLFNGTGLNTVFRANLSLPPLAPGECIRSQADMQRWLEKAEIDIQSANRALFAFTAGPESSATSDDRDMLRAMFDDQGRFLGMVIFSTDVQAWQIPGVNGELKTIYRTQGTLEEDMKEKLLSGWQLCDGSAVAPDLTPKTITDSSGDTHDPNPSPFFKGAAPDWDIYTVMRVS